MRPLCCTVTETYTIDPLNNASLNGKIECKAHTGKPSRYALWEFQINMHIKCIIVFKTTSFYLCIRVLSVSIYGTWTLFILCASQIAYITQLHAPPAACLFMPKWCRKFDYKPTHTVVPPVLLFFIPSRVCGNANEAELCNMLFYFPIFDLLKMQISIEHQPGSFEDAPLPKAKLFYSRALFSFELQIFNFPLQIEAKLGFSDFMDVAALPILCPF